MVTRLGIALVAVLMLCSCSPGPAREVAKTAAKQATKIVKPDVIAYPKRIPPVKLPRGTPPPTVQETESAAIAILEPHVDDAASVDQAVLWVQLACKTKDLYEISTAKSWPESARKSVEAVGGNAALRLRVESLAKDLRKAETGTDIVVQLGAFMICETV